MLPNPPVGCSIHSGNVCFPIACERDIGGSVRKTNRSQTFLLRFERFQTQDGNLVFRRCSDCTKCFGIGKHKFIARRNSGVLHVIGKKIFQLTHDFAPSSNEFFRVLLVISKVAYFTGGLGRNPGPLTWITFPVALLTTMNFPVAGS